MSIENRFWKFVVKTNSCWEWIGYTLKGYGRFHISGKSNSMYAHRFSWMLHFGKIPEKLFICHHCDNPKCVNPSHLFLGTPEANSKDCIRKGRNKVPPIHQGENARTAKLTSEDVKKIRNLYKNGKKTSYLSKEFNIDRTGIWKIVTYRSWRHI